MLSDLRLAFRQLRQAPAFAALVVLTLAVGIGANTALFSVVHGVLLRPLPFRAPERLVTLGESNPALGFEQQRTSPRVFEEWRAASRSLAGIAFWTGPMDLNLQGGDGIEKVRASYASASLFSVLGIAPQLGRGFVAAEDVERGAQVAVLSHRLWRGRFGGDTRVLGQTLTIDTFGKRTYTIVGVMPAEFDFPAETELWLPAGWNGIPRTRLGPWLNVIARLADGSEAPQARGELSAIQARIARDNPNARLGTEVAVVPLARQMVGANARTALLVLWGVVAGVLLIACVNVANLMLARATLRQREMAVRLALGAGRARIVRQLLVESVLLAALGGAAGALLAGGGVKAIVALSPPIARLDTVAIDGVALWFTAGAALLTGVGFGLAPAWQGARTPIHDALKASGAAVSASPALARFRGALVVAEVALATVLLVLAGLMLQSFARLTSVDRGVRVEHLLTAELDFSVSGFTSWVEASNTRPQVGVQRLLERVRGLPGVTAAGAAYGFPVFRPDNQPPNTNFSIFGRATAPNTALPTAFELAVTPDYLTALGAQVRRGRDVSERDQLGAPAVVLINESFARRYFAGEDPIGQHLTAGRGGTPLEARDGRGFPLWAEIVGVVSDVKSLSSQPEAAPTVYRSYWQWPMQAPVLAVRTAGEPAGLASAIRQETKTILPNLPLPRIRTMTERVGESVAQAQFQARLLNVFAVVGTLLAAVGIFGVLSYGVTQRRREIGLRMALGAQRRDVLALILGQGCRLVLTGAALGLLLAAALTRTLRSQLYAIEPLDAVTYGGTAVVLLGVALVACWWPARRAARIDPMTALRAE